MNKPAGTSTPTKPIFKWSSSPNFSARGSKIARVILHYTTAAEVGGTLSWFKNPASRVSAHYVVDKNGDIYQCVRDSDKAWHAFGENDDSIGIEHVAVKGDSLTPAQSAASAALCRWLLAEYHLESTAITAHRFTASNKGRTDCPGDLWQTEAELRSWVHVNVSSTDSATPQPVRGRPYAPCPVPVPWTAELSRDSIGHPAVYQLQCALIGLGFLAKPKDGELVGDVFNEHVEFAVRKFQLAYMREEDDGIVGPRTRAALQRALTEARAPKPAPTPGTLDVPYFSQRDYGGSQAWSICGVTSAAMVLKFWGKDVTPDTLLRTHGKAAGQSPAGLEGIYESFGLKADSTTRGKLSDIRAHIAAGRPCVVHGYFTGSGHIIVVTGFSGELVVCNDPAGQWEQVVGDSYADNPKNGKTVRYSLEAFREAVGADGDLWYSVAWK